MPTGLLETPQGSRTTYWELLLFGITILSVLWDHITVREDISRADVVILSWHTPTKVMCREQSPVFPRLYLWNVPHLLLWRTRTWWPTKGQFCLLSYLLSTECHLALLAVVYRQSRAVMENNQMAHLVNSQCGGQGTTMIFKTGHVDFILSRTDGIWFLSDFSYLRLL